MNANERGNQQERQFGDVVDQLHELGGMIDKQRYPGMAWHRPTAARRVYRMIWPIAAAAVAAGVILAIAVSHFGKSTNPVPPQNNQVANANVAPADDIVSMAIETDPATAYDLSGFWEMSAAPANVDMEDMEGLDWLAPTTSTRAASENSTSHGKG